jgi:uncharacterized protein
MIAVDTGYFIALANPQDKHHQRAVAWMTSSSDQWITTWPVITETCYFLTKYVGEAAKTDFLTDAADGAFLIWDLPRESIRGIPPLMRKYQSLPMDLADASLVLLAEHLGHGRILTTDTRDFGAYRWKNTKPFVDLMARSPSP